MKNPLFLALFVLALSSCSQQKSASATAESTTNEKPTVAVNDMAAQGFYAGVIHAAKDNSACAYTIETKDFNYPFDPTNLKDEFKKDDLKVWFKYTGLRMQNRCPEATPVEVNSMSKRK